MEMRRDFFTCSFDFSVLSYVLTLQGELIGGENKIQMDVLLHSVFSLRLWFFLLRRKLKGDCGQWNLVIFFLFGGDVCGGLLAGKPLIILLSVALSLYGGGDLQAVIFIQKYFCRKKTIITECCDGLRWFFFSWPFGLLNMVHGVVGAVLWMRRAREASAKGTELQIRQTEESGFFS